MIFVIVHRADGSDSAVNYSGMTQDEISGVLTSQGTTFDFVDEPTYNAFVQAHARVN